MTDEERELYNSPIDGYEALIATVEMVCTALGAVERYLVKTPNLDDTASLRGYLNLRESYSAILSLAMDTLKSAEQTHTRAVQEFYKTKKPIKKAFDDEKLMQTIFASGQKGAEYYSDRRGERFVTPWERNGLI